MSLKNQKRIAVALVFCLVLALILFIRLFYIQVIKSNHYKQMAYEQQTRERKVAAKRGTIYDATGTKVLAQSVSVSSIKAVPNSVENKEAVAQKLAEILEMDKDKILAKLTKNTASEIIATKVDSEKSAKVLEYTSAEDIDGIKIDEDTERIYPYGELLSHVLGFVGTDNQGLAGIEAYYDDDLSGVPRKNFGKY